MIRPLVVLGALVLVLALSDAWLAAREARARATEQRIGALFPREEAERLRRQPALRVELGGESHSYGRIEGRWRCLSTHRAPADAGAIQGLLDGISRAEGIVYASTSEEAPGFGINTPQTLRVSIQGPRAAQDPGGDVLATLEIGLAQAGQSCFVRRKGTREIWSIAADLRAPLERRVAPGLPPLLEPAAVPSAWRDATGGAVRIVLARGETRTVLERRDRELDPAEMQPGLLPWKWVIDRAGGVTEVDHQVLAAKTGEGFTGFLERLPYVAVLDPARRESLGHDAPRATVTLEPREGPPLHLAFGAGDASGRVALWVDEEQVLYLVEEAIFALAVPQEDFLTAEHGEEDPWSAALRAAGRER